MPATRSLDDIIAMARDILPCSHGRTMTQKQFGVKWNLSEGTCSRIFRGETNTGKLVHEMMERMQRDGH